MGLHRVFHRGLHRSHGSQMHDGAATVCGALNQRGIGDITLDQFKARVAQLQVVALAGGEVVEHAHGVPFGQQRIAQV